MVRQVGGDVPPQALLEELHRLGWVEEDRAAGLLRPSLPNIKRALEIDNAQ
jgi:hypothetical protein